MRARLTASFVVLSVVLLVGALWIRGYTQHSELRTHESRELRGKAALLALLVEQRSDLGAPVDRAFLAAVVDASDRVEYAVPGQDTVVAEGKAYDDGHADDAIETSVEAAGGRLTVTQAGDVLDGLVDRDAGSLGFLVVLAGLVAALAGYLMARVLSGPFRQLAGAARQLGRGRFDLDLPRTRIPEAKALSQAMLTSAGQLQERLASEQAFAEHASHVLRTPLTGLRLELEDLVQRDDLPADLVALSRRGALVAGSEIALRDLATQCAQTWADALAEQDRPLTAAVEGNIEITYTPGPVEHILDLLLADVLRRGRGAVRIVFEADDDGHLSIGVSSEAASAAAGPGADMAITQARAVVTALGGRLTGETPEQLSILLPRR